MDQKDLEYFRNLLTNMLEEAQKKGDTTLEELSGTSENFADPADRATAESDRAFTLRIRDRERRLIKKVKELFSASMTAPTASAKNAARKSASAVSKPVR